MHQQDNVAPRVGDVFVSTQRDHPIPVQVHSVGTNHVRVFYTKKKRRNDNGRWLKVNFRQLATQFRFLRAG